MKLFKFSTLFKIITLISLIALLISYLSVFVHPTTFKFLPLFSLAYPIILVFNLVLLILWAFARSRWFFYVLIIFLIGGKLNFRMLAFGSDELKEIPEKSLKILSYNVRLFDVYNVGFNKDYRNRDSIFQFLSKEQADIVCFQEFYIQNNKIKHPFPTKDTLHQILNAKFYHARLSFNKYFKNFFGVAMYSKHPMITKGQVDFDDTLGNTNNFCIFADIKFNQDTFRIYNTHFQSIQFQQDDYSVFNEQQITGNTKSNVLNMFQKLILASQKRARQVQLVLDHMKQSPYEVVIMGDFNETPMTYNYNLFYNNYTDAFKNSSKGFGFTYAGKVPAGRIDYIFHSKAIESSNFTVQKQVFSDHRAIKCNIWKKKS